VADLAGVAAKFFEIGHFVGGSGAKPPKAPMSANFSGGGFGGLRASVGTEHKLGR